MLDVLTGEAASGVPLSSFQISSLRERATEVAQIAKAHAADVDRNARFPDEAVAAMKQNKLLGLLVPLRFGGEGATLSDVAEICFSIARECASSGMILAMHYAALSCVARHAGESSWHMRFLCRVAAENLILASSTTEGSEGGNVRSSSAPLVFADGMVVSLERAATVVSYGAQADAIVTTARRTEDSAKSDQALVVFLRKEYSLVLASSWETLGMRGTCSAGFAFKARAPAEQVLPVPYRIIHSHSLVPVSHLLWGSAWAGIAAAAVAKSQSFVRSAARRAEGRMPPGAGLHTRAVASFNSLRSRMETALRDFDENDAYRLDSIEMQTALNLLKVDVSEGALSTVLLAMQACGLAGYREDGDFSIARHLRDILSAPIMIHNERILSNIAAAALMSPSPSSLRAKT